MLPQMSLDHLQLRSSDGDVIRLPVTIARCSDFFSDLLRDLPESCTTGKIIFLNTIDTATLRAVKNWYISHESKILKHDSTEHGEGKTSVYKYEFELLKVSPGLLLKILRAANFLAFEALLETSCYEAAIMIKRGTLECLKALPEEIQLRIAENLTPYSLLRAMEAGVVPSTQALRDHVQIWTSLFSSDAWFDVALQYGAQPILVGFGLVDFEEALAKGERIYLALASMDWSGDLIHEKRNILNYLQTEDPENFDSSKWEVQLGSITLNIWEQQGQDHTLVSATKSLVRVEADGRKWTAVRYLKYTGVRKLFAGCPGWGGRLVRLTCPGCINPYNGKALSWVFAQK